MRESGVVSKIFCFFEEALFLVGAVLGVVREGTGPGVGERGNKEGAFPPGCTGSSGLVQVFDKDISCLARGRVACPVDGGTGAS